VTETEKQNLDFMQSVGKKQEHSDTACHFLMSPRIPYTLPEGRQKVQEMILQDNKEQKGLQSDAKFTTNTGL
jgi:hypothetical protein